MLRRCSSLYRSVFTSVLALGLAHGVNVAHAAEGDVKPTEAGDFSLRIEPGVSVPLTSPQAQRFAVGRFLDLGPSVGSLALPSSSATGRPGGAWLFGVGLRLKRPHDFADNDAALRLSPWVDVDALYARTGPLDRPAFDVGAGVSLPIGRDRTFWIGPFVRYLHVFSLDANPDNGSAGIFTVGLSLEVGSRIQREAVVVAPEIRTVTTNTNTNTEVVSCPDRDNDTIPDTIDICPDVVGPLESAGCPPYKAVVVKRDKLELKQKIQFEWNQAVLQPSSYPALDEIVQALKDNKSFRVQVGGYASSEGDDDRNQELSEKRAEAVLDYLANRGIARDRLTSKGFSSSNPRQTNVTESGREANRRVEFILTFIILPNVAK
jgi:outer membrane protein OmpA-like peptidoglycan-associated protein